MTEIGQSRLLAWREFRNKAHTFWLVRHGFRRRPGSRERPWREEVAAVQRRPPQTAVFSLERLGRRLTEDALRAGSPRRLFEAPAAAGLPESSLILLHAGMGLTFADGELAALPVNPSPPAVRAALHRFAERCRENSLGGYLAAALEPLGVIIRLFHTRLFRAVEAQIADAEPELASYFWHGVGRAHYFLPWHQRPFRSTLRAAIDRCYREPRARASRLDALQGLFFAATMVNLRHPPVVAALLEQAEAAGEGERFSSGLTACLLARQDMTPEDPAIPRLLAYRPPAGAVAAGVWEARVAAPGAEGLRHYYPVLKRGQRLGLLAHRVSLPWLVDRLEHGEAVEDV